MPRLPIPIDGGFYLSESLPISAQECSNWFVNIPQTQGALSAGTLFGCSGIDQLLTTGEVKQVNRGALTKQGKPYFVNGETLYRIDRDIDIDGNETFTAVSLGTIPGEERVSISTNGKQLMIVVPGVTGYIVDETILPVFQEISDPDFTANGLPLYVTFIDSFFVVATENKKIIKSAANDGLSWDALDFGSAESNPDAITALLNFRNKLYVGGEVSIEEQQNLGLGGFPFQRTGLFLNKGVFAPFTIINTENTFMFIGGSENESPAVWALNGNSLQKVSTTAIDSALQRYTREEIEQSFSYVYAQRGAYFVGFSLPTRTFEYNTVSGRWNERTSQIVNTKNVTQVVRWRANSVVSAYGRILCGDSQDGRIGEVNPDIYSEYGNEIIRRFALQPLSDAGNALSIPELELTMESGVGDLETIDPEIRLETSLDNKTFSNSLSRGIGRVGEYFRRQIWYKLGRFPRFVTFRFTMSDKVKPVAIKLEARIRGSQRGR